MRRLLGILACAALLAAPAVQAAPAKTAALVITGQGGQSAELVVPRGGITLAYELFPGPRRLPGGDTAVGGVAFQRASDGVLAGGVLLHNAPGFDEALTMPLVESERTRLPAGRFRLTLLGTGPQTVRMELPGRSRGMRLAARGPSRPVTRVLAGSTPVLHEWSTALGRIGPDDQLVVGAGTGGDLQQAGSARMCVQQGSGGGACLLGEGFTSLSPGAGSASSWSSSLYGQGSLPPGAYAFSGSATSAGAGTGAHLAVVISLPR